MSLIGWWPFTTDGRNQGTASTSGSPSFTSEENGKLGKCAFFNKTYYDSNLDLVTQWNPWTTGVSMSCWVKFNIDDYKTIAANTTFSSSQSALTGCIIGHSSYGGMGIIWMSNTIMSNGTKGALTTITATGYMRSGGNLITCGNCTIPTNTWVHLTYVADPATKMSTFYINGVQNDSKSYGGLAALTDNRIFAINRNWIYGGNGPGISGPLRICDVRLYDHPITVGEVQEISRGLIAHYDFNYLDIETNLVEAPNDWSNTYDSADGSGQGSIGVTTKQSDGSMKVVDTASNSRFMYRANHATKQGETFLVSIKYKLVSGDKTFRWQIQELNSAGSVIHTHWTYDTQSYSDLEEGWQLISYVCTIQNANTTKLRFWLQDGEDYTTYTHTYYIKDFSIQKINSSAIIDSSGYGYNASFQNKCNFIQDTERGQYAFRTAQTADRGDIANASFLRGDIGSSITPTSFTISMWAKINAYGAQESGILQLSNDNIATYYQDCTLSQYDGNFALNKSGDTTQYKLPISFIPDSNWHHVAVVWDGTKLYGYLDGEVKNSIAAAPTATDPFRYIFLGLDRAGGATRDADITWGEFKLYMTALNADAIKNLVSIKASVFDDGSIASSDFIETDTGLLVTKTATLQSKKFYESISDEYDHLEYIESTGTQYINTGFIPNQNSSIELEFHNLGSDSLANLFGARITTAENVFAMWLNSTNVYPHYGNASYTTNGTFAINTNNRLRYRYNKNIAFVGENSITCGVTNFNSQYALCLLAMNDSTGIDDRKAVGRLFKCNIYDGVQLVRSFIPAKRRLDGAVGLYDAVNKQFYANTGTGSFTAGPALSDTHAAFYESGNVSGRNIIEM